MLPRLVVFGYGNPSRGDDALGPLLLERLEAWRQTHPGLPVELVADFQLQIEHVLDLEDRELALFLDSDMTCPTPFAFWQVQPRPEVHYTTHQLSPGALLAVFARTMAGPPPLAFTLSVRGSSFELGLPLSAPAKANLEASWAFLLELLANLRPEAWLARETALATSPDHCPPEPPRSRHQAFRSR